MIYFDKHIGLFHSSLLPIVHGFTTRQAGEFVNTAERERFLQALFKKSVRIATVAQIHSDTVAIVSTEGARPQQADALVYKKESAVPTCLYIQTADCVPILLYEPRKNIIAAVHSGWQGSLYNIVGKTVKKMKAAGAHSAEILAVIGPSIGPCCYPLFGERLVQFRQTFPTAHEFIEKHHNGFRLNLSRLVYRELIEAGVLKNNIDWRLLCTSCQANLFFSSHRTSKKQQGTLLAYIAL